MNQLDNVQTTNEVIGYVNGKAIILNDDGELLYIRIPEEHVTIGEFMFPDGLNPVSYLTAPEQREIERHINRKGE